MASLNLNLACNSNELIVGNYGYASSTTVRMKVAQSRSKWIAYRQGRPGFYCVVTEEHYRHGGELQGGTRRIVAHGPTALVAIDRAVAAAKDIHRECLTEATNRMRLELAQSPQERSWGTTLTLTPGD